MRRWKMGEDVGWNGSARVWLGGWSGDIRCGEGQRYGMSREGEERRAEV